MFTSIGPRALRRVVSLALLTLAALPALGAAQRPGAAHAATTLTTVAFFNNSSYPIVELTVDHRAFVLGQDDVPGVVAPELAPQATLTLQLLVGPHTYSAGSQLDSGSALRLPAIRPYAGSFTALSGSGGVLAQVHCARPVVVRVGAPFPVVSLSRNCVTFNDPSIEQLLTRGGARGVWTTGPDPQAVETCNGAPGCADLSSLTYFASGTADLSEFDVFKSGLPTEELSSFSFTYRQVSRNPTDATVTFLLESDLTTCKGVYSETHDVFQLERFCIPTGHAQVFTFKHG